MLATLNTVLKVAFHYQGDKSMLHSELLEPQPAAATQLVVYLIPRCEGMDGSMQS